MVKKKILTIEELQRQISIEESKQKLAKSVSKKLKERKDLEFKLKKLKKTPSQRRNEELFKRTARGGKVLGKKFGKVVVKQAKLIKAQQLRDQAKITKGAKKKGKKIQKSSMNLFEGLPSGGGLGL